MRLTNPSLPPPLSPCFLLATADIPGSSSALKTTTQYLDGVLGRVLKMRPSELAEESTLSHHHRARELHDPEWREKPLLKQKPQLEEGAGMI